MDHLKKNGASFFGDIDTQTHLLKSQVEEGLAELVANGLITNDSYSGLRALLTPSYNRPSKNRNRRNRKAIFGIEHTGRWSLTEYEKDNEIEPFRAFND